MKRLLIAAAIAVILAVACAVSANDVNHSCNQLLDTLSAAQEAVEENNMELAEEKTKQFREQWDR